MTALSTDRLPPVLSLVRQAVTVYMESTVSSIGRAARGDLAREGRTAACDGIAEVAKRESTLAHFVRGLGAVPQQSDVR